MSEKSKNPGGAGGPGKSSETIDPRSARRIALLASGLSSHRNGAAEPRPPSSGAIPPSLPSDAAKGPALESALDVIRRLGSVQIDTISVVERAHHHILWSRSPTWRPEMMPSLETPRRSVFEYWSHAAAYLPIEEWRYCLPRMERLRTAGHPFFDVVPGLAEEVLERIENEGPLSSDDWEDGREEKKGWWDWKPAKLALEYLFQSGELMTVTRSGFRKVFDLRDRVLPRDVDRRMPDEREMAAWHLDRAERSLGIFAQRDVAYLRKDGVSRIDEELAARHEGGRLLAAEIAGGEEGGRRRTTHYTTESALGSAEAPEAARAWLLSPFDPLLIDRRRFARLFGAEYQIECYVPETKRRFGYFALPLIVDAPLEGPHLAGLVDAKLERKEGVLRIKRMALRRPRPARGEGVPARTARLEHARAVGEAIASYANWQEAPALVFERIDAEDPVLSRLVTSAAEAALKRLARRGGAGDRVARNEKGPARRK